MTITITKDRIIKDIQKEFNLEYPFLKIEFFKKGYQMKRSVYKETGLSKEMMVGLNKLGSSLEGLQITGNMTVKELERKCEEVLGLSVQVYRKSGNLWLETTMTDNWTLNQQNESGRQISQ
jgi:hypothetical protein